MIQNQFVNLPAVTIAALFFSQVLNVCSKRAVAHSNGSLTVSCIILIQIWGPPLCKISSYGTTKCFTKTNKKQKRSVLLFVDDLSTNNANIPQCREKNLTDNLFAAKLTNAELH